MATLADFEAWKIANPGKSPAIFAKEQMLAQTGQQIGQQVAGQMQQVGNIEQRFPGLTTGEEIRQVIDPNFNVSDLTIPTSVRPYRRGVRELTPQERQEIEDLQVSKRMQSRQDEIDAPVASAQGLPTTKGIAELRGPTPEVGTGVNIYQPRDVAVDPTTVEVPGQPSVKIPGYAQSYIGDLKRLSSDYVQPEQFKGDASVEGLIKELDHLNTQPKTLGSIQRMQELGLQIQTDINTKLAEHKKSVSAEQNVAMNELQAVAQKEQQRAAEKMEGLKQSYDTAVQNYQTTEIDPERWAKNHSKLGRGIAIVLGGLGATLQQMGGNRNARNEAVDTINRLIDQDIGAQQINLRKMGQQVDMERNRMGFYSNLFKDEEAARHAAKADLLLDTKRQMDMKAVEYGSERVRQDAAFLGAQLSEAAVQSKQNALQRLQAMSIQKAQFDMQRAALTAKAQPKQMQLPPGLRLADPHGYIPNKKDTKIAQKKVGSANAYSEALEKVMAFQRKHAAESGWDRATINEGKQLINEAIIIGKVIKGMGAHFTDMERELIGLPEDPTGIGSNWFGGLQSRLDVARNSILDQTNAEIRPYGFVMERNARGAEL